MNIPKKIRRGSRPGAAATLSREDQVATRRRNLLDAAIKVITKRGLTGITINMIAAEANCSYGAVSFHFQSKDGMICAALDHAAAEYESFLKQNSETRTGPADRIRRMIETDFNGEAVTAEAIGFWLAFWAEAVRIPVYRARCAELREHYNRTTAADITELADARGVTVDAARIARTLNSMITGLWIESLLLETADRDGQRRAREDCLAYMRLSFPEDF